MTAERIIEGLNGSLARLPAAGHTAALLLTTGAAAVEAETTAMLATRRFDVVVIGAGLRTLPPMAREFETLMNVLHAHAPQTKFAFNTGPADSDAAARRFL